ncbi:MAG TPA: trehalose-phosphatase [Acidobacteriaceae bacterium]
MSKEKIVDVSIPDSHPLEAVRSHPERGQIGQEATPDMPGWRGFFEALAVSSESALLLDFDGTLAPFRIDPAKVRPWTGIAALLNKIQQTGRTRIALVSGRPAQDVAAQLKLAQPPEVWGLHGAEHLLPDGSIEYEKLPLRKQLHLKAAHKALDESGWLNHAGIRRETKWNAVVVHWRGLTEHKAVEAKEAIHRLLSPIANDGDLETLLFDGGIEMRAGRTKGDSVDLLLAQIHHSAPAAYLGDDTTDEFAFRAINASSVEAHRLSVLVRRQWRPTAAHIWIRPPASLRAFLGKWLQSLTTNR